MFWCFYSHFCDFIDKYRNRKTIPKDEALNLLIEVVVSCEYPLHRAACYLVGDTPTTLPPDLETENMYIKKFNDNIKSIAAKIRNYGTTNND